MRIRNCLIVVVWILFFRISISEAGQFINLGFDDANYSGNPMDMQRYGVVSDLIPGWRLFYGMNEQFVIGFNLVVDSGYYASIFNRFLVPTVEGQYSFQVTNPLGGPSWVLEQQGDVPPGTQMLSYTGTLWTVEVNGEEVPPIVTQIMGGGINQVSYDFSQFAGKPITLDFVSAIRSQDPFGGPASGGMLDSITFIVSKPLFVESDFNGDGFPDVVFEHEDGFVGIWFMNNGPELISANFFNPKSVDPRWHIVGIGDFVEINTNKTDLLFQHEDGSLAVWSIHEGTNLFWAPLLNPSQPGGGWKVVGTGDMNHDGKIDIVFQHTDGTLGVWFMDGINLVQAALLNPDKPGDLGWRVVGTAHLTSAGNTDLILQHTDGTLAAWYMDRTNLVQGTLLNPSTPGEPGWRVATTLDLNADGKTDLIFQHDDGTIAVWFMDGINLIAGEFLNPDNPGAGWRIAGPR